MMCSRDGGGTENVNEPVRGVSRLRFAKLSESAMNVPESVAVVTMRAASAVRSFLALGSNRRYRSDPICRPNPYDKLFNT